MVRKKRSSSTAATKTLAEMGEPNLEVGSVTHQQITLEFPNPHQHKPTTHTFQTDWEETTHYKPHMQRENIGEQQRRRGLPWPNFVLAKSSTLAPSETRIRNPLSAGVPCNRRTRALRRRNKGEE
ncbi:hypothetical protein PIB30_041521 [Stylosanthes scabra]|uniref:Uncharacterized protein n=1 Tax=Stylosanthes scabra TaxID=79078 RepID=A0ABU6WD26_9FABA|nr:hypothetical protein [Stylosanthes scabra]